MMSQQYNTRKQPSPLLQEAKNPHTHPERLRELSLSYEKHILHALARNPNTPSDILINLIVNFPHQVLANPIWPLIELTQPHLLDSLSYPACMQILRCEHISPLLLSKIAAKYPHHHSEHVIVTGEVHEIPPAAKQRLHGEPVRNIYAGIRDIFTVLEPWPLLQTALLQSIPLANTSRSSVQYDLDILAPWPHLQTLLLQKVQMDPHIFTQNKQRNTKKNHSLRECFIPIRLPIENRKDVNA